MSYDSVYHSEWYLKNRDRLLPMRRAYNKEYSKRPEVIEKAKMKNATLEAKAKRKAYKKTVEGRKAEHKYRNKRYSEVGFDKHIRTRYNITFEQYIGFLKEQNNICAICLVPSKGKLHVDHCHTTNKVRGLLCGNCNRALGILKENISSFENAIKYLQRNG